MDDHDHLHPGFVSLLESWPLFDNAIVRHGYVPYMRDYELVVVAIAAHPDGRRSYREGRYRFLFTHCVVARVGTALRDETWRESWADVFTDYQAWEQAGAPAGYVWGVNDMAAYPGATCVRDSVRAREWTQRLGAAMHEVRIETDAHVLELVFHWLRVQRVARGDPESGELVPIEPEEIGPAAG